MEHKVLSDKEVHMFAVKHKLTPDKVEEAIYKVTRKCLGGK
jgi:hypothetical protein